MVFWALEQRKKRAQEWEREQQERERKRQEQERERQENAARERERLRTQAKSETIAELLAAGIIEANPALERWARWKGIDLSQLPPVKSAPPAAPGRSRPPRRLRKQRGRPCKEIHDARQPA